VQSEHHDGISWNFNHGKDPEISRKYPDMSRNIQKDWIFQTYQGIFGPSQPGLLGWGYMVAMPVVVRLHVCFLKVGSVNPLSTHQPPEENYKSVLANVDFPCSVVPTWTTLQVKSTFARTDL
jgi:hypothetical protein